MLTFVICVAVGTVCVADDIRYDNALLSQLKFARYYDHQ